MIRDVPAPAGLIAYLDATRSKHRVSRQDVRPTDFLSNTERDDRRMLDEQQKVADAIRTPILDQRALQLERLRIRHGGLAARTSIDRVNRRSSSPARV